MTFRQGKNFGVLDVSLSAFRTMNRNRFYFPGFADTRDRLAMRAFVVSMCFPVSPDVSAKPEFLIDPVFDRHVFQSFSLPLVDVF
jgi:hypothetical protein